MMRYTLTDAGLRCPMSTRLHYYRPGGHAINCVHWVFVATHVSRASRCTLGGATPATHRCWVVALVGGLGEFIALLSLTHHTTHTQPSICDGAHKQHGCARAQMHGCVFRCLLARGTHAQVGVEVVLERTCHDSHACSFVSVFACR